LSDRAVPDANEDLSSSSFQDIFRSYLQKYIKHANMFATSRTDISGNDFSRLNLGTPLETPCNRTDPSLRNKKGFGDEKIFVLE
jgi:hypothetical protein